MLFFLYFKSSEIDSNIEYYSYKQFLTSENDCTSVTFLIIPWNVRIVIEVLYNIIDNATKKFEANLTIQADRAQEYSNDSRKPKPELINIAHMSLLSSRILTNEQFDLTCQSIFTPEKFFKQNEEGIHIFCPCCRTEVVMQNHHMYCKGMNGLTKQIHNAQVSNIINIIDKKHNPMVCRTARQVNDDEQSKLQPDIVTKDNQTFDFSVSKNPLAMYKTKIEKYGKIFDNKNVIPIIITPWLQMDPRSIIEMSRYCKPDKLFKSLSKFFDSRFTVDGHQYCDVQIFKLLDHIHGIIKT
ncbi:Reverse_transcriptase [Hexamita inflata]|uniref:Putative n=1 Tax=Hexamita inflata TaxID=28002 RepID=A0AA86P8R0_9EUKA|nr:Reverse transcriptase [Hexamita inflata]